MTSAAARPPSVSSPLGLAALRALWPRWTAVVASLTGGRRGRRAISPDDYVALHGALIRACESCGGAGGPGRSFFEGLENLARPWVTLDVLMKTDRQILIDLYAKCRLAELRLTGRRPHRRRLAVGLALTALAAAGAAALWHHAGPSLQAAWAEGELAIAIKILPYRLRHTLARTTFPQRLGAATAAIVLLGIVMLRGMRKY